MTTMTRGKKLFVLLLALVILTGVTLLVAHLVPDEDESTAEDTSYIIFSLDPDQVTQLSWTYETARSRSPRTKTATGVILTTRPSPWMRPTRTPWSRL